MLIDEVIKLQEDIGLCVSVITWTLLDGVKTDGIMVKLLICAVAKFGLNRMAIKVVKE